MSLQNFFQLACDSILRLSIISFCSWLMRLFTKGSCAWEYFRLSQRFSLISSSVSSETGWLSGRPLLDVGMALFNAVLIAVTIKSAYLSISCVDLRSAVSPELSATSRVDLNTFDFCQSGQIYTQRDWCVCFYEVEHLLKFRWVGDRCPSCHLLEIGCHVQSGLVK